MQAVRLEEHIAMRYGTSKRAKAIFAKENNARTVDATRWIEKGYIVVDGYIYSKIRAIK